MYTVSVAKLQGRSCGLEKGPPSIIEFRQGQSCVDIGAERLCAVASTVWLSQGNSLSVALSAGEGARQPWKIECTVIIELLHFIYTCNANPKHLSLASATHFAESQ